MFDVFCLNPDKVQPRPSDPEGGKRESCSFSQEDAVAARQNAHAHE